MIKNILFGLVLLISPFFAYAHNPLSAKYDLIAGENASLLTINLSQDGVNKALLKTHKKGDLEQLNRQAFDELIIDYIKDNFTLLIDGEKATLKGGGIKFGAHQTDIKLVLPPISKNTHRLEMEISAFAENKHHQTIFYYHFYDQNGHIILSEQNNYQASIQLAEENSHYYVWIIGFVLVVGFGIALFVYRRKKKLL